MKTINMMKKKNAVKERILSLEETNKILKERLKHYEYERNIYKENVVCALIDNYKKEILSHKVVDVEQDEIITDLILKLLKEVN